MKYYEMRNTSSLCGLKGALRESILCGLPEIVRAGDRSIHIWNGLVNVDRETLEGFFAMLSGEEKQRALRFHAAFHRRQYIASHGLLRAILGAYAGVDPQSLAFCTNEYGKPFLSPDQYSPSLFFNMSHSHGLCTVAICQESEIGIDIEYARKDINVNVIAESFFTKKENEKLNSLIGDLRKFAFYQCWTRKEAYLKGKGKGLSLDLRRIEVSLLPSEAAEILRSDDFPEDVGHWHLLDLGMCDGYIGTLAVAGGLENL